MDPFFYLMCKAPRTTWNQFDNIAPVFAGSLRVQVLGQKRRAIRPTPGSMPLVDFWSDPAISSRALPIGAKERPEIFFWVHLAYLKRQATSRFPFGCKGRGFWVAYKTRQMDTWGVGATPRKFNSARVPRLGRELFDFCGAKGNKKENHGS